MPCVGDEYGRPFSAAGESAARCCYGVVHSLTADSRVVAPPPRSRSSHVTCLLRDATRRCCHGNGSRVCGGGGAPSCAEDRTCSRREPPPPATIERRARDALYTEIHRHSIRIIFYSFAAFKKTTEQIDFSQSAMTTELVLAELLCCDCECAFCNSLVFHVSAFYFILWAVVSAGYPALLSRSYFGRINDDDDDDKNTQDTEVALKITPISATGA